MSTVTENTTHGHSGHGHHDPHLAHHFDTPEQQFTSAKLGMWVFLGTEILMFGGLFCAYSIYRHNHPLVFKFAAESYLSTFWGTTNTIILITSSLTMAWGVRAAQLNQRKLLITCLVLTLLGAAGFLVVKSIEYSAQKWHEARVGWPRGTNITRTTTRRTRRRRPSSRRRSQWLRCRRFPRRTRRPMRTSRRI